MSAIQESKIEKAIGDIEVVWSKLQFPIANYKGGSCIILADTSDIQAGLYLTFLINFIVGIYDNI